MMKYSFDDEWFGMTKDYSKLDEQLVKRPPTLTRHDWYAFASELSKVLNKKAEQQ